MSKNRNLSDFIVKRIAIKKKVGSRWVATNGPAVPGAKYRLEVDTGNKGRTNWGGEGDYNKVLLEIRIVAMGFRSGSSFVGKNKIEFYTNT